MHKTESINDNYKARQKPNRTGIPTAIKAKYEKISGLSFDDVRVHYNSVAPAQMRAYAYTQGNNVYIAPNQEKHLEHELGHVVQQKRGIVRPNAYINGIPLNTDKHLESEASRIGRSMPVLGRFEESVSAYAGVVQKMSEPQAGGARRRIINREKQGRHIVGNRYYISGRSIFAGTIETAQTLLNEYAGTGEMLGGYKERVNFGRVIGKYVDPATGTQTDTTMGIIHYSNTGAHIVPARPISEDA